MDGVTSKRIGSYLTIVCSQDKAVVKSLRSIRSITSATFRGSGDSSIMVTDVNAVADGTGTKAEISFAKSYPEGSYLNVDLEVDMKDLQKILATQRIQVTRASEEDLTLIRNAVLNKK